MEHVEIQIWMAASTGSDDDVCFAVSLTCPKKVGHTWCYHGTPKICDRKRCTSVKGFRLSQAEKEDDAPHQLFGFLVDLGGPTSTASKKSALWPSNLLNV